MRFILAGFGSPLKAEYKQLINGMGGQVLTSLEYEIATHIVPMGGREGAAIVWELDGKRVYSKEWLDSLLYVRPKALEASYTGRTRNGSQALYPGERRVRRRINFDSYHDDGASLCSKHHDIFKCPFDKSTQTTLLQFAEKNRKNLIYAGPTPGSFDTHWSIVGSTEIKLKLRRAFRLIQALHKENISLCGKFGAENFFYDDDNNARIGNLMEDNLKYGADLSDKNLDYESFVKMVKKEVFVRTSIPNSLSEWLCLMSSGVKGFEYLLCHHDGLMEPRQNASSFMSLHDIFLEIETSDPAAYGSVLSDLRQYNYWKSKMPNNSFLKSTKEYMDKDGKQIEYKDDVKDLLRFLRNCRRHAAQFKEDEFPSIVDHFYPKLMCDFQKAMFKQWHRLLKAELSAELQTLPADTGVL
ncbi:Os07g0690800 [Oryza sativa Japonica Group]|uniref:Os07g0690800 protein n=1 Tax=Oryza sativa subsp. japonica TaxID=39947 RepID=A0A0P0XAP7_ORYSJ|nr:Os07g0690800 [Oryza sativa Japonica Group]